MATKKQKKGIVSIEQLESEYGMTYPVAERFCAELASQLNQIIAREQISLGVPVEYRIKKWESLISKLERLSMTISSVKDLNDYVGLRVILLFRRDLFKVCELIESTFKVLDQYDTQERLKEDQFGYSSVHFIIKLPEPWLAVPTLAEMGGLKAEIQVRTVAQHIWAAASHTLQYKKEDSVPPPVRRAIYRVSALLETVDLEFERVLEQRESYRSNIDVHETEDLLNVDLLEKSLDSLLPEANKSGNEEYSRLLEDLLFFQIDTVPKLTQIIRRHLPKAVKADAEQVKEYRDMAENQEVADLVPDFIAKRITKGVFFNHAGLVWEILRHEYGQDVVDKQRRDRISKVIKGENP